MLAPIAEAVNPGEHDCSQAIIRIRDTDIAKRATQWFVNRLVERTCIDPCSEQDLHVGNFSVIEHVARGAFSASRSAAASRNDSENCRSAPGPFAA